MSKKPKTFPSDFNLCHCGTVDDARVVAEKLFVDLLVNDCPTWGLQVATMLRTLFIQECTSLIDNNSMPDNMKLKFKLSLADTVNMLVRYQKDNGSSNDALLAEVIKRKANRV